MQTSRVIKQSARNKSSSTRPQASRPRHDPEKLIILDSNGPESVWAFELHLNGEKYVISGWKIFKQIMKQNWVWIVNFVQTSKFLIFHSVHVRSLKKWVKFKSMFTECELNSWVFAQWARSYPTLSNNNGVIDVLNQAC